MVIAASTTESYALIMTIERVFSNIKTSDESVSSIQIYQPGKCTMSEMI